MGIFDSFRAPAQPTVAAPTSTLPAAPAPPPTLAESNSKFWEKTTPAPAPASSDSNTQKKFLDNFTPENITGYTSKYDALAGIDQTRVTAALAGDPTAFSEVINHAVRNALGQSITMSGAIVNGHYTEASSGLDSKISEIVNSLLNQQKVTGALDHPALKTAAGQQFAQALKQQILTKDPEASPETIKTIVNNQLTELFAADPSRAKPITGGQELNSIKDAMAF